MEIVCWCLYPEDTSTPVMVIINGGLDGYLLLQTSVKALEGLSASVEANLSVCLERLSDPGHQKSLPVFTILWFGDLVLLGLAEDLICELWSPDP